MHVIPQQLGILKTFIISLLHDCLNEQDYKYGLRKVSFDQNFIDCALQCNLESCYNSLWRIPLSSGNGQLLNFMRNF